MKKRIVYFIIGLILLSSVIIVNLYVQKTSTKISVDTTRLEIGEMKEKVITKGSFSYEEEQLVFHDRTPEENPEVLFRTGDTVKKGDVLVKYSENTLKVERERNKLLINKVLINIDNLQNKQREIENRIEQNLEDREEGEKSIEQLQVEKQLANLDLQDLYLSQEVLDKQQQDLSVKSNFDAKVLVTNLNEKNIEDPLLHLGSYKNFVVTGSISEFESLQVKVGQKVKVSSELSEDFSWFGEVVQIGDLPVELIEGNTNRYPITIKFKENDVQMKPGFGLLLEIETNTALVESLPNTAVIQEEDEAFVYLVENSKVFKKEVSTGIVEENRIEITSGVSEKDVVILSPTSSIKDGSEVIIDD